MKTASQNRQCPVRSKRSWTGPGRENGACWMQCGHPRCESQVGRAGLLGYRLSSQHQGQVGRAGLQVKV